ncbi:MAG: hypothetical protein HC830_09565 [Bacteroidetes bacterium]|nr:hypothetical protein [Bacteroidota bacterium]
MSKAEEYPNQIPVESSRLLLRNSDWRKTSSGNLLCVETLPSGDILKR